MHILHDVQISSIVSHPSCTFSSVNFLTEFLNGKFTSCMRAPIKKEIVLRKKIASFCAALFHAKFGRFWSESVVEK